MNDIVLRYGEINLKGKNRDFFERILRNNINKQLRDKNCKISHMRNRSVIEVGKDNIDDVFNSCLLIPGVENISLAKKCETNYESIKQTALEVFDKEAPKFRVSTKRSYKAFEYTSQEFSKEIGAQILKANDGLKGLSVSMREYDQEIGIEILKDYTYIYHKKVLAMGGLPIGSSGKGLVLLSGGIDSPIASIEAMKRGIKISCIHFSTPPYTTQESLNKVLTLVDILRKFDSDIKFYNFNITNAQLEIVEKCRDKYTLLLMRRLMYRKSEELANKLDMKMLITGESIGQVASQTIESITMTNSVVDIPVIRPLITFNKQEIITLAKKYKTYETSIIPFEDACSFFAPKKPVTKPQKEDVLKEEENLDINKLLRESQEEKVEKQKTIDDLI